VSRAELLIVSARIARAAFIREDICAAPLPGRIWKS
jgi:hypothetical protein